MIESTYQRFLTLTGSDVAAAVLTLAESLQAASLNEALTVDQAAARLGVHAATVRRAIKNGSLPYQRVGKVIRIRANDLTSLNAQRPEGRFRKLKLAS